MTFCLLGIACSEVAKEDPLAHIADDRVKEVLLQAFDSAGGLNTYQQLDSVIYRKKTVLYLEDGRKELETDQIHRYKLFPEVSGTITWTDSVGNHKIVYSAEDSYTSVNGQKDPDSAEKAASSFFSNYYVLFLPFKLSDPGATLTYEGQTKLESGENTNVIKAVYNPETHDNHSTSDEWYLFFDVSNGRTLANLVYHPPTYAYIVNMTTTDEFPLRMNLYRQTWRTDSQRNKEYLRGEFWYSDYKFTLLP